MSVEDSDGSAVFPEGHAGSPTTSNNRTFSIDQLIERWWQDHFPGSAIARDTQAWNAAFAAKEALKRLLKREYLTCS
ncbi:MAG: hypothetical protein JO282_14385 [Alphaproteobacteria bacterium]|nr:hypothetical protein [Alphaproteobacteria bacterium]